MATKAKGRAHATMQAQTDGMSEQTMKDLAAYLSASGRAVIRYGENG